MREFTIGKNDAGQRLDRFLGKTLPLLPPALAQKYIRLKRVLEKPFFGLYFAKGGKIL